MFENLPLRPLTLETIGASSKPTTDARAHRIDSRQLLAGDRELVIDHAGQEYRLRLTRNDKLILTK